MAGFIAGALSSLLKDNKELVADATALGKAVAFQVHRVEEATNLATGERTFRWQVEFKTREDAETFGNAVRSIAERAVGDGQ